MSLDLGGRDGGQLRLGVVFLLTAGVLVENTVLLLLGHDHVALRLLSDVNASDLRVALGHIYVTNFVFLALLNIFEGKHSFLAHKGDLLVGPDLHGVLSLVFDFVLQLYDRVLEVVLVVLALLRLLEEELSLLIEASLHVFLNRGLLFDHRLEVVPQALEVIDEHLVSVSTLLIGVVVLVGVFLFSLFNMTMGFL